MCLYPEYSSQKGYNNSKERKYIQPAGSILPCKHHKYAREKVSKYRGALRLNTETLMLTVDAFDSLRLV